MPHNGLRLSLLLSVLLLVPALAAGAELDLDTFDWNNEFGASSFEDGQVLPGRLIVRFAPGAEPAPTAARGDGGFVSGEYALDRAAEQIGALNIERLYSELPVAKRALNVPGRESFFVVNFDPAQSSVRAAAEVFARLDGVVSVEPDEVYAMHSVLPNDPGLSNQWWLRNTTIGGGDIRALAAWSFSTGSPDVLVCVADSGVDWQHPEIGGTGPDYTDGVVKINQTELNGSPGIDDDGNGKVDDIRGWDFVNGLQWSQTWQTPPQDIAIQDPDPMDYGGHGTSVTGCISVLSNNGVGIASSNWTTKILPCRVGWTDNTGQGLVGMSFASQAFDYARIMGADVFNCSWGSGTSLAFSVNAAIAAGMIIVESAGNSDNQVASYLGSRGDIISVAATNSGDSKASFSTYGTWVDISAPGVAIYTTSYNNIGSGGTEHTYASIQGTSFSSPIVAGAFALAKSYFPSMSRNQLIDLVLASVDNIDATTPGYVGKMGSGRLNLTRLFYDGSIWPVPQMLPTINDAMQMAAVGDTVAIEGGFVTNGPVLFSGTTPGLILGGFDPTYTTRDPMGNPSIMQIPVGTGTVLTITGGVGPELVVDGFQITGGHVTSPSLAPDEGFYGGGIRIFSSSPVLRNLTVTGNQAGNAGDDGFGGGIAILSSSPVLENVTVTGNQALSGAGIYVYDSSPTFIDVNVQSNTAWAPAGGTNPFGGGMYMRQSPPSGAPVTIDGGSFSGNTTQGSGGGAYFDSSDFLLSNVVVENNSSLKEGAGIAVNLGSIDFRSSRVENNNLLPSASILHGGGVYTASATVSVDSVVFRGNSATFAGGGIAVRSPVAFSMSNSTVVDNTTGIFGAGVYVETGATGMSITGSTVANNSGGSVGGNGIYVSGGDIDLQRNIVASNFTGSGTPNGFNLASGAATFSCNLFFNNADGNYGGVTDPTGSNGNIDADPLFCDAVTGDYTLDVSSPAATAACGFMGGQPAVCNNVSTGIGDETPGTRVRRFALEQNSPNPFNPITQIRFSLPKAGPVQLRIYDVRGRLVRTLVDQSYEAGAWTVTWNGRDDRGRSVASGAYLYELRADNQRQVRKMGLLK